MSICNAINNKNTLSFTYDGYSRIVEPHTYGVDGKGHEALRAYQTSGGSESHELGWKLFHVNEIHGLVVLKTNFQGLGLDTSAATKLSPPYGASSSAATITYPALYSGELCVAQSLQWRPSSPNPAPADVPLRCTSLSSTLMRQS